MNNGYDPSRTRWLASIRDLKRTLSIVFFECWMHHEHLNHLNVSGFIAQLVRVSHQYRDVTGGNHVEVLTFSGFYIQNCKNCVHNCEKHSLLDFTSAVLYMNINFHTSLHVLVLYSRALQCSTDNHSEVKFLCQIPLKENDSLKKEKHA